MYTVPGTFLSASLLSVHSTHERVGASEACHPQPSIAEGGVMSPEGFATTVPHYNNKTSEPLYLSLSSKGPFSLPFLPLLRLLAVAQR